MKKATLFLIVLSALNINCFGQGWFLTGGFGYAVPHAGKLYDLWGHPFSGIVNFSNNGTSYANYDVKKASLSAGLQGAFSVGYMLNEHLGFEFGMVSILAPASNSYSSSGELLDGTFIGNSKINQNVISPFLLTPSIVLQYDFSRVSFFSHFGLALPLSRSINFEETDFFGNNKGPYTNQTNEIDYYQLQYKTDFSVGFTGALGIGYNINEHLKIVGEVSMLSLSLYINEIDDKAFNVNGQMGSTNPSIKFGFKGSNVSPSSGTGTQMTDDIPFSNICFKTGVYYTITPHIKSHRKIYGDESRSKRF